MESNKYELTLPRRSQSEQENIDEESARALANTGIETLPAEIVFHILSKLPISSLLQFKLVCRAWRMLPQHPHFLNLLNSLSAQENHQCFIFHSNYPIKDQLCFVDFDAIHNHEETTVKKIHKPFYSSSREFDVVSSSNGLLCLFDSFSSSLYIYNPFSMDYRKLPQSSFHYPEEEVVMGFGFDQRTKQYKVVKIIYYWNNEDRNLGGRFRRCFSFPESDVLVFSLGRSSWRSLGQASYYLDGLPGQVLLNGRIHWETHPQRYRQDRNLVSFDLEDEQFREVPKPNDLSLMMNYLALLRGCLTIGLYASHGKIEIWVMKEYGVKESWVKEFIIASHVPQGLQQKLQDSSKICIIAKKGRFNRVLCVLLNGDILLEYKGKALILYDPNTESFKDVIRFKGMPSWFETVVHVGSLIHIDTLIGI